MPRPASRRHSLVLAGLLLATAPSLSGCLVAAAGAGGAAGGYSVFGQERSADQQVKDAGIGAAVSQSWGEYNQEVAHDLTATVYNGRVLITGRVPQAEWRQEAVKRAWKVDGVKEVYDEIEVGPDTHFMDEARDTVISTRLRNDLLFDKNVRSINYTIRTENGVVYIIGTARSQDELNHVTEYARNIPNVRRVVSYVRIRSGEPAQAAAPAPADASAGAPASPPPPGPEDTPAGAPTPRATIDVQPLK